MIETMVLCGCSRETSYGKIVGVEGCGFCGGRGMYRVRCEACCDTGKRWGSDDICDCPAGLPLHAKTEPSREAELLAAKFKMAIAIA